ncbi:RNA binding protein, partial [Aspergillus nomiae NRRL 13137]
MPQPQKGKSRPRGSDEEFVLFLQGIPAHCRWQELKDLVRQTALHIRQAVVYDDHHGFPTGLGQIIVKNEDEAWRTYHRLSTNGWEGQSLVVTLARTSSPTRPIAGPTKSPHCGIPSDYVAGYSTPPRVSQNMAVPPSPISPEPMIAGTSPTYPPPEYGHAPVMSFMPIYHDPLSQHMPGIPPSPSFCDPLAFTVYPPYPVSPMPAFQDLSHHQTPHKPPYSYTYSYTPTPIPFYA